MSRIVAYLRDHRWDWTAAGLGEALAGIEWVVRERQQERPLFWLASPEHPPLIGLAQPLEPGDEIVDLMLGVTGSADELDAEAQAELDGALEYLAAALPEFLGLPDYHDGDGQWPMWSGMACDVGLWRTTVMVAVAATHRANLARFRGEPVENGVTGEGGSRPSSPDGLWDALGAGLGRLLGSLGDLDRVSFLVNDAVVLAVSRDGEDVWLLATGPEDQVEPVDLSPDQQTTLATIGFQRPLGDSAEHSPQRSNWWYRLRLPADPLVLESAGHMLAAAARHVYGADRPGAIVWFGMALTPGTRRVLASLPLTTSEF